VGNQRKRCHSKKTGIQIGGVIYADSADKAARFIMDCNQTGLPMVFFQDVQGFMVGRDAEQSGIIRAGAKLVNVVSNSVVPKITVILGGSFGAGNYALCGKAFDPRFIFAWPNARYAVMGGEQASDTLFTILQRNLQAKESTLTQEELNQLRETVRSNYKQQTDIRYGAARGWVDAIIPPHTTRDILKTVLGLVTRKPIQNHFQTGVLQV
jgi:acetyl-CoA carboxylase carboxyltransferase component